MKKKDKRDLKNKPKLAAAAKSLSDPRFQPKIAQTNNPRDSKFTRRKWKEKGIY